MTEGLKSDIGNYVSIRDFSTLAEEQEQPPPTIRVTFRNAQSGIWQLTESMRKSVETVTDLLVHTAVEETRARFLADASARLFASNDEETTFATLAHVFVPILADGACIFSLHGSDASCRVVAHVDTAKERFVQVLARRLAGECGKRDDWVEQVFRQGRGNELSGQTLARTWAASGQDQETSEALAALSIHWLEAWPLVLERRVLGAVFLFGSTLRHQFDVAGGEMLQSLTHHASLAVDNARLHEQARQAIRARERLMAFTAHDLRNSLSLALMSLSAFDGVGEAPQGAFATPRIAFLRKGLWRMQRLVDDLLDFSCIESGHLSIAPTMVSVSLLVEETLEVFREVAVQKGVRLVGKPLADGCQIEADGARLLQVLSNLVGNALKFTPAGGEITVTVVDRASEIEFSVVDTGCGISAEELPLVFEAYRRSTRSRAGGVGLGLSISKGIVESHGGKMEVESQLGKGTTFFIRLPKRLSNAARINGVRE